MRRRLTIFSGTKGLNTQVDPVRLIYDWKTGVQYLSEAVNVDIDATGRISRRKGYVPKKISARINTSLVGTAMAFVDGGAGADTITDSGNRFITSGLRAGDTITITNATTPANNGAYIISAVAAGTLSFPSGSWNHAEVFGANTAITARKAGYHSLFSCGSYSLGVSGDALKVVEQDYSDTSIRAVTPDARMRYAASGDTVYYMNGHERGYVRDRVSYEWVCGDYVGPETTKTFFDPPTGHLLAIHGARMYIAQDNVIWHSQPFAFFMFDLARNFIPVHTRLRMMVPVADGLWISDDTGIFFIAGLSPKDFSIIKKADYPAVEGTDVIVNGYRIGTGDLPGMAAVFTTEEGICIGGESGRFLNITGRTLTYPKARYGSAYVVNDKYAVVLQP